MQTLAATALPYQHRPGKFDEFNDNEFIKSLMFKKRGHSSCNLSTVNAVFRELTDANSKTCLYCGLHRVKKTFCDML